MHMLPLALASLLGSTSASLCRPSGVIVAGTPVSHTDISMRQGHTVSFVFEFQGLLLNVHYFSASPRSLP